MMEIEEAFTAYLKAQSSLTALISTRLFPIKMPQDTAFPCATYQIISKERTHAFQQDAALTNANIQVSAWGKSYASVKSVAKQVRAVLQNYSGLIGGSVTVNAVLIENEMDDYDNATDTYVVHQEFEIWYQEVD
jgi:hypothetical protein